MLFYIAELSKYIMAAVMALYVFECFIYTIKLKNPYDCKGIFVRQRIDIIIIISVAYITMCLRSGKFDYLINGLVVMVVLAFAMAMVVLLYPRTDQVLLNNMILLLSIGFIILSRLSYNRAFKQFCIVIVSFAIVLFIPVLIKKCRFLKNLGAIYAALGIVPLGCVLLLGKITNGSKLSYTIGGITIQPSEFVKIIFVFCIAAFLAKSKSFIDYALGACLAAIHVIILVLSKDLGSALIFFITYLIMMFIASRNYIYMFLGLISGAGASVLAYKLFAHVRVRVLAFRDPFSAIDNQGYQITQSLFAISCGNFFGTGLMKGAPKDIPTVESDFIFSAVSEEMGVIFAIGLLCVCLSSFFIIMLCAIKETDKFYRYVSIGLGTILIFQTFLTVGGGIKFIPLTGVTLPLVSYGGSSVLSSMIMYFICMGIISSYRDLEYDEWFDSLEEDDDDDEYAFMDYIEEKNEYFKKIRKEKKNLKKHNLNKTLETRIVVSVFSIIYISMGIYLCLYVKNNEQTLINNSYNSRQTLLAKENTRGSIFDRNGEILAQTLTNEDGKEYRNYPYANMYAHAVGYMQKGRTGIESMGNYYLINSNATITQKVENDLSGNKNPGNNIYTTFDTKLQEVAYNSLGMFRGAVVVSDVKTGEILAMVSKPDFDPNTVYSMWDKYIEDTESGKLLNRVTQGLYPPGSTFKIFTTYEYVKENPKTFNNYHYSCKGAFTADGIKINCYHGSVHGQQDLVGSFAHSCNSSFANIGMTLNRNQFGLTLNEFMFNEKLPLEYNYSVSNLEVSQVTKDYEMAQISIGQGKAQITPILLNMVTNGIANNGVVMTPRVLDKAVDANGVTLEKWDNKEYKTIMTEDESRTLTRLMESVVTSGTAKRGMAGASYTSAGKTGSAEFDALKQDSHAWYTGFAPLEDPQISVTIIVESVGAGGDYAVPIARRIFDAYFDEY